MLPTEARDEIKRMKLMESTYMDIVNHLKKEQGRPTDHRAAQAHIQRRVASLSGLPKKIANALQNGEQAIGDAAPAEEQSAEILARLSLICAALSKLQKTRRSPAKDPDKKRSGSSQSQRKSSQGRRTHDRSLKGCWHCGQEGRSRTTRRGANRGPNAQRLRSTLKITKESCRPTMEARARST